MTPHPFDGAPTDRVRLHRLWPWLRPYRPHMLGAAACGVLAAAAAILVPVVTSRVIIDEILLSRAGPTFDYGQRSLADWLAASTGVPPLVGAALLDGLWIAFAGLFSYLFARVLARIAYFGLRDLRGALFAHVTRLPASFYDRVTVGQVLTRITTDVESLSDLLIGLGSLAGDVLPFIVAIAVMVNTDLTLTLEVLPLLPLIALLNHVFRGRRLTVSHKIRASVSRINEHLHEHLSGIEVVQLSGSQDRTIARFTEIAGEARTWESRAIRIETVFLPLFENLPYLAMGVILGFGAWQALNGRASIGTIVLFVQFSDMLFRPIINLGDQYNALARAAPACDRIFRLLDWTEALRVPATPAPLPDKVRGEIVLRNLSFGYKADTPVLKSIDLSIRPGESVAIVGPTGSGKTTLTRLISRFYDLDDGMLFIDGVDIMRVEPADIRRRIGVILQDFHIFPGTVLDNVTLGNPGITRERAIDAARLVHALAFIEALPRGWDTPLESRGGALSQGQRQLLAFARAIALDPEILILDEATASIDAETEQLIQSAMRGMQAGRTTIIIAHRLQTIREASRILVLDQGRIVESGTHTALIALNGLYRKLHELQSRRVPD